MKPAPHHSLFYRPDALLATQPTASALKAQASITVTNILTPTLQKFSQAKQSPDVSQKLRLLCLACEKCCKLALYDDSE